MFNKCHDTKTLIKHSLAFWTPDPRQVIAAASVLSRRMLDLVQGQE